MIKKLSTKIVYQNKWMNVREDDVEFPNGSKGIYSVVEKPHFAMIVPFENQGFYLVKQFRYPVSKAYWEFPQGSYEENPNVNPIELAKGELKEETGLSANKMKKIGFLYEAYGFSNQGFHVFLAEGLKQGERKLQAGEQGMQVLFFTLDQFEKMIESGGITDAPTVAAYGLLKAQGVI